MCAIEKQAKDFSPKRQITEIKKKDSLSLVDDCTKPLSFMSLTKKLRM